MALHISDTQICPTYIHNLNHLPPPSVLTIFCIIANDSSMHSAAHARHLAAHPTFHSSMSKQSVFLIDFTSQIAPEATPFHHYCHYPKCKLE